MKRHTDALGIAEGGASNPAGIARSLVEAIDEARGDRVSPVVCPAVKLIVHQLCHVIGLPTYEELSDWIGWRDACRNRVAADAAAAKVAADVAADQERSAAR